MKLKIQTSALKKFPKSKKFKFTKLPAQKAPDRFSSLRARDVAEKAARDKFGDAPEYMGMSQKSVLDMASEKEKLPLLKEQVVMLKQVLDLKKLLLNL